MYCFTGTLLCLISFVHSPVCSHIYSSRLLVPLILSCVRSVLVIPSLIRLLSPFSHSCRLFTPVCLDCCLSVCPFVCLSVCLSVRLSDWLTSCLDVWLCTYMSTCIYVYHLSKLDTWLDVCLPRSLTLCLSRCSLTWLDICLFCFVYLIVLIDCFTLFALSYLFWLFVYATLYFLSPHCDCSFDTGAHSRCVLFDSCCWWSLTMYLIVWCLGSRCSLLVGTWDHVVICSLVDGVCWHTLRWLFATGTRCVFRLFVGGVCSRCDLFSCWWGSFCDPLGFCCCLPALCFCLLAGGVYTLWSTYLLLVITLLDCCWRSLTL